MCSVIVGVKGGRFVGLGWALVGNHLPPLDVALEFEVLDGAEIVLEVVVSVFGQ